MREHVAADEPFERTDLPVDEARRRFEEEGQDYKVELIRDLVANEGVETVSLYRNGPFTDLCRGPHAPSTGRIKAFKLLSVAGAYWRGDERNKMLTRIYGTAFLSKQDLERHLEMLEQARARDHRRLGPSLGLFVLRDEAPGMPFYLPNGTIVVNEIQRVLRERLARGGYGEIRTPQVLDVELWKRSGHWDNYRENMFFTRSGDEDGREFALKPMNCPGACLVYASGRHSYRELPLRLAEFGLCTRNEREGVLHGLLRVRAFTQDDGHVFCTEEQIVPEARAITEVIDELYSLFGFEDVRVELSTRPEKSIGTAEQWEAAERALAQALEEMGREYQVNPGDGAFYGPEDRLPHHRRARAQLAVRHLSGRLLHAGAVRPHLHRRRGHAAHAGDDPSRAARLDRALPRDPDRAPRRRVPGVACAGAGEGAADRRSAHVEYAQRVERELRAAGVRVELDERSESVGPEDPRCGAFQGPVHAGGGRQGAGGRGRLRAPPRGGRLRPNAAFGLCRSNPAVRPSDVQPGAILASNDGHFPTAALDPFCRVPIPSLTRPFAYERTALSP